MDAVTNWGMKQKSSIVMPSPVQTSLSQMPLYFIANQGQMDSRVTYYVQGSDKTLYFTPEGVTFTLTSPDSTFPAVEALRFSQGDSQSIEQVRWESSKRWNIKLDFIGANSVQPVGLESNPAVISYFKGSQDQWHTALPTYSKINYPNLW